MLTNGRVITETAERLLRNVDESADDDLAEVADLIVIAVVHYGTADEGEADVSSSFYACTTGMVHRQLGLLEEGRRAIEKVIRNRNEEE